MSRVRSLFWILHLRRISKSVIRNCPGCKTFRNLSYHSTNQGSFPKDRTEKYFLVEGIDRDYMRVQFTIKPKGKGNSKHIYIFCSVPEALQIELVSNLTTTEFYQEF